MSSFTLIPLGVRTDTINFIPLNNMQLFFSWRKNDTRRMQSYDFVLWTRICPCVNFDSEYSTSTVLKTGCTCCHRIKRPPIEEILQSPGLSFGLRQLLTALFSCLSRISANFHDNIIVSVLSQKYVFWPTKDLKCNSRKLIMDVMFSQKKNHGCHAVEIVVTSCSFTSVVSIGCVCVSINPYLSAIRIDAICYIMKLTKDIQTQLAQTENNM
jgi:hypothetical protein